MRIEVMMKRWVCGVTDDYKEQITEAIKENTYKLKRHYTDRGYKKPYRATITVIIEKEEKNGTLKTQVKD